MEHTTTNTSRSTISRHTMSADGDLEKRDSTDLDRALSHIPTASTDAVGRLPSHSFGKTKSYTDGYSTYGVEDDEVTGPIEAQRTKTSAYEVTWEGKEDKLYPRNYGLARKWLIVIICSSASFLVTAVSSIYSATYEQLEEEFNTSREVATLGLTLFVLGTAFGPMFLAPLSEFYGRRPMYLGSMFFFVIWLIPSAVAKGMATMIVARFLDGFAGSAFLAVAAGTVVDLFEPQDIAYPMMIFTVSPFLGPAAGPIIGGFICQFTTWRWVFYMLLIWSGVIFLSVVLFVPETFHKVLLVKKAQMKRLETGNDRWYAPIEKTDRSLVKAILHSCTIPFKLLLWEPMCLLLCLYSALLLGILYLFFGAFALVFSKNHHFQLYQIGLSFCGLGVGIILAAATNPWWVKNYLRLVKAQREREGNQDIRPEPEYRLPTAMCGGVLCVIGLFWFGWTTYPSVHWIVPIIGSSVFGAGMFLCFQGILTFLVDAYPEVAASAIAANVFVRLWFAGAFPLFGIQMYEYMGYQWATSLLGFLALLCVPMPFLLFKYGKQIRAHSRFGR